MIALYQRLLRDINIAYASAPLPRTNKLLSVGKLLWWHVILKRVRKIFIGQWLGYLFLYHSDSDGAASSYYMPHIEFPLYFLINHWPSPKGTKVFFDVGANIGNYSLMAAGQNFLVHAFDPNKETLRVAKINVLLNNLEDRVVFSNVALSDKAGKRDFYFPPSNLSGLGSFFSGSKLKKGETTTQILDNYCHSNNINHIDLLKIDVEGAEFLVLSGAAQLLRQRSIDAIFWEAGGRDVQEKNNKTISLLNSFGYQHFAFDPDKKILRSWNGEWNCLSVSDKECRKITKYLVSKW